MNVLMITGDKMLVREGSEASKRLALQRSAVKELRVIYWGRGNLLSFFGIRGQYDVVTSQDPLWRGLIALFLARKLGTSLNIQVHGDLRALSYLRRILAKAVLRRADTIRVVSVRQKAYIERIGVPGAVRVLPIYIDVDRFARITRAPVGHTVLWVGRFESEKDPVGAISVFREVLRSVPDARLIMLGEGNLRGAVEASAEGLPIDMPGWKDPAPYLAQAAVVFSTSPYESFGASIIEALASGAPVVAPDVGIAKEAGAIIVPREKLGEAVIRVLIRGERGRLMINLLPALQWTEAWRATLV
jgi:glycosyltransferase involved in cell wall biosynthesis